MSTQTIMCITELESEFESSVSTHQSTPPSEHHLVESSKLEADVSFYTPSANIRDESFVGATLAYLRLLYYQYEVTFTLYMLTPGEKYVLNTIVVLLLGLTGYCVFLMLPQFVIRAAGYWFWDVIGRKDHAVRQVFRLNTTGSAWDSFHPAMIR